MTLQNAQKWYDTFIEQGRLAEAADMLKNRPEIKTKKSEPKPPKEQSDGEK